MAKKISTTVYLDPEQDRLLKLLNQKTKVPVAEYIRQGIDMLLRSRNDVLADRNQVIQVGPSRKTGHGQS